MFGLAPKPQFPHGDMGAQDGAVLSEVRCRRETLSLGNLNL